jgi:hypothetical protein
MPNTLGSGDLSLPRDSAKAASTVFADARLSSARERLAGAAWSATLVLCWFAAIDALTRGAPWWTAYRLGVAAGSLMTGTGPPLLLAASVVVFLCIHYAIWLVLAFVGVSAVRAAERDPRIFIAIAVVGILAQLFVFSAITLLAASGWGSDAWIRFGPGALIGGATLALYLYRSESNLVRVAISHVDDDADGFSAQP